MKKFALALSAIIVSGSVFADDFAQVIQVVPRYVTVQQQQCQQVYVQRDNSGVGTIIGGVAGGIIGNQVGAGVGKGVATVIGTVIGAGVGERIGQDQTEVQQRTICNYVPVQVQQGRIVTFKYQNQVFTQTFMN